MSYDAKCYDLAKFFLDDLSAAVVEKDYEALAQDIQDTIESYLREVERDENWNCEGDFDISKPKFKIPRDIIHG